MHSPMTWQVQSYTPGRVILPGQDSHAMVSQVLIFVQIILFFPDYVDFNKIQIPQADEQQRLLANIILQGNLHRKPLPKFWFLPRKLKAAVVMTGDDHANGGTVGQVRPVPDIRK